MPGEYPTSTSYILFKGSSIGQSITVCAAAHLPALFHQASELIACSASGEKSEGWTWLETGTENKSKCNHIFKNDILSMYFNKEFTCNRV